MKDFTMLFGQGTGAVTYFRLGFCPSKVKLVGLVQEDMNEWYLPMLATPDNIGTVDSTGNRELDGTDGISLCQFNDGPGELPGTGGTPTELEPAHWYKANGIKITASCEAVADGNPYIVEAYRLDSPIVRLVHDGGDNTGTYFQDSSVNLVEAGVTGDGKSIVINESNDNYAYCGTISTPSGGTINSKCTTFEDAACSTATAAANFDDDNVLIVIPVMYAQSPMSGIGLMT